MRVVFAGAQVSVAGWVVGCVLRFGSRVCRADPGWVLRSGFAGLPPSTSEILTRSARATRERVGSRGFPFGGPALAHTPDQPDTPETLRSGAPRRPTQTSAPWWGGGGARRQVRFSTDFRLEGFAHPQSSDVTTWLGGLRWGALGVSASADRRGPGRNKRAPCLSPWPRAARIGRVVRAPARPPAIGGSPAQPDRSSHPQSAPTQPDKTTPDDGSELARRAPPRRA